MTTFKTKFAENSKMLQERQRQLEKLNKNRGKSKKDDKKRMELETEIAQKGFQIDASLVALLANQITPV